MKWRIHFHQERSFKGRYRISLPLPLLREKERKHYSIHSWCSPGIILKPTFVIIQYKKYNEVVCWANAMWQILPNLLHGGNFKKAHQLIEWNVSFHSEFKKQHLVSWKKKKTISPENNSLLTLFSTTLGKYITMGRSQKISKYFTFFALSKPSQK